MPANRILAIVTPVLNDWASLAELIRDIARQPALADRAITIVAVDDGSSEVDPPGPDCLTGPVHEILIVELNANQGHQRAIALGLAYVEQNLPADLVVVMDSDGEDVPGDIAAMLACEESSPGSLIVARRTKRSESLVFKIGYGIYKWAFYTLTGKPISFGNFSLIPRRRLPNVVYNSGVWNNYAATLLKCRIPIKFVPTHRGKRYHGQSSMNFTSLMLHGFSAISVFTDVVIGRIIIGLVVVSLMSAALIATVAFLRLFTDAFIPGYATYVVLAVVTMLVVTLFTGFLLVLSLLAGRDRESAIPSRMLSSMIRKVDRHSLPVGCGLRA
jgi:glycosyltransferase involved in cell wall biosynthesis